MASFEIRCGSQSRGTLGQPRSAIRFRSIEFCMDKVVQRFSKTALQKLMADFSGLVPIFKKGAFEFKANLHSRF